MYMQDNKAAYATLTVALYNGQLNIITQQELTKVNSYICMRQLSMA